MTDAARAYSRWLGQRGLSRHREPNPMVSMMRRLDELEALIERAFEQRNVATDRASRRRAERKLDRVEREQLRIYDQMDTYAPYADVQLAIYEDLLREPEQRSPAGPTRFTHVPDYHSPEED